MHYFYFSILLIASYFLGSLNGAHIIAKLFYGKNISLLGTKNAGAGNTFKTLCIRAGFAAGVIDFIKGAAPVLAGSFFNFSPAMLLFVGASTIAGNNWPKFFRKKKYGISPSKDI